MALTATARNIITLLTYKKPLLAEDIAAAIAADGNTVINLLQGELRELVQRDESHRWSLKRATATQHPAAGDLCPQTQASALAATPPHLAEPEHLSDTQDPAFAFDSLESVRRKLLDLSGRNPLLNYKHPNTNCIRLIDEMPNQIFTDLQEDKTFCFIPLPSPTERELLQTGYLVKDLASQQVLKQEYPTAVQWAKHKGLSVSFDLPQKNMELHNLSRHRDRDLQTLLFAPDLEVRLRSIRGKADTALEEAGANILYLVLGFLEWYESSDASQPRYAPLFTVPVQLERGKLDSKEGIYSYTIKQKDDGYLTNVTLREKLAQDFDLVLPSIEEDTQPEDYFEKIQSTLLNHQPRWSIKRQATLALLDFAKQAMYEDLNPAKWPSHKSISDHPLIRQFFSAGAAHATEASYATEHAIDTLADIHEKFPLIYEADSSQHSAIVDAVRGDNLVIEGPPGTGKSQTITNLIAAAIANGKRVLFVAEKMAALEVVKNRLQHAGLGDFCLELHSHKSNKLQVLTDLNNRLQRQDTYGSPQAIATDIARYEDLKNKLSHYVELINSPWLNTGLTLHQIFTGAVRYREELSIAVEHLQIHQLDGENLTPLRFKELTDNSAMLSDIYHQVAQQAAEGNIARHYWYGVNKTDLVAYEGEELSQRLRNWTQQLKILAASWNDLLATTQHTAAPDSSISLIAKIATTLVELPELDGSEPLPLLPLIAENPEVFARFAEEYHTIHRAYEHLSAIFKPELLSAQQTQAATATALTHILNLGIADSCSLLQLSADVENIKTQIAQLVKLQASFTAIKPQLPDSFAACLKSSERGLQEFATLITLVRQLSGDLWRYRNEVYDNMDLDAVISSLRIHFQQITPLQQQLAKHFNLDHLPNSQHLKNAKAILDKGGFFRFFSSAWRSAKKSILALATTLKPDSKQLVALLPQLIEYRSQVEAIDKIHSDDNLLGDLYKGVNTPIERIVSLRNWYKAVRREYGIGFGERVALGSSLLQLDRTIAASLSEPKLLELATAATGIVATIADCRHKFTAPQTRFAEHEDLLQEQSPLHFLAGVLAESLQQLQPWVAQPASPIKALALEAKQLAGLEQRRLDWQNFLFGKNLPTDSLNILPGHYSAASISAFARCASLAKHLSGEPDLLKAIAASHGQSYAQWQACGQLLLAQIASAQHSATEFASYGQVNLDEWTQSSHNTIHSLILRNESAMAQPLWLTTWLNYIRVRSKLTQQGLGAIIANLESCQFPPTMLATVFKRVAYHQLAKQALATHSSLDLFSGMEQMAIRNKFQEYDKNLLQLQRKNVAFKASRQLPPQGVCSGKVSEYTETSLIKHEAGKKMRHIPVRSLLKRANESISTLKPCFMMSPMSVAQYLEPGEFEFDLVIMDEASQIRPEDALGAIARGKSLIVVGDPKQLPPTSFFQRALNNQEDGDDVVAAEQSESILETVIPMFRNRRLRWHYRSQHESLIAFSNKNFYDHNLVIFPSPLQQSEEFGIVLHRIIKGRFVTRRNSEEAREIVATAACILLNQPQDSVGIVAMSAEQKDEIEKQLEQYLKDNPLVALAYERNQSSEEPIFVKNLENVQGDERDIILISMTYGPEQIGARTMQRFGPINSDVGGRRLNVLFTRAKKQMHIFSSMASADVLVSNTSSRGVRALRAFLEYCETQHLHSTQHSGKAPDSDFEIAVMRALESHGYQCEPQLGTAGYFLDIAVRDPGNPGRFLLGIECDGASYHSAKSARDRDRLRQEVLERLGWRIRRIWSTDWFANPQAQLAPLLKDLGELRSETAIQEPAAQESSAVAQPDADLSRDTGLTLKQRLIQFNQQVIVHQQPATPDTERLLRPSMLEALLTHQPTSKAEFFELIPPYLRNGTVTSEDIYLDQVLEIVADYC